MKKLLMLFVTAIPFLCNAQFTLTPDGFKADEKDFYVVEIEGNQADLFNKAKMAITQMYISAKDAATFTEPSIISLNGFSSNIESKDGPRTIKLDMRYSLKIMFKDGKIRFDAPDVLSLYSINKGREVSLYLGCGGGPGMNDFGHIFKKDGQVRNEKAKLSLENYFNALINSIVEKIQSPVVEEDW